MSFYKFPLLQFFNFLSPFVWWQSYCYRADSLKSIYLDNIILDTELFFIVFSIMWDRIILKMSCIWKCATFETVEITLTFTIGKICKIKTIPRKNRSHVQKIITPTCASSYKILHLYLGISLRALLRSCIRSLLQYGY